MVILASGAEMFVSFIVDSDFYLDTGFREMIKSRMRVHVQSYSNAAFFV